MDIGKIQSLYFDAEKWLLKINGKQIRFPLIIEWPDDLNLNEDTWTRRMLVNSKAVEEAIVCEKRGDRLPVITISFKDGTGSYAINNTVSEDKNGGRYG